MEWMTTQNRKKQQRRMNKVIRKMNENVRNDPMWKGRFYMRQIQAKWLDHDYEPGYRSLYTRFVLIDRKTGKREETGWASVNEWCFLGAHQIWRLMNDFILNSGVWEEEPRITYENTPDYRSCK